ncbi:hypothetical protein [Actinoplanes sp. NPDC089786]|uniref:hypothetical protein n=1 Tax=Actinoplanes sp. NPDC089786 TaxID=3155185 RepID=UPI003435E912
MVTRRTLLGAVAGAGAVSLVPFTGAEAATRTSANRWPIDPDAVATFRVAGSAASVVLRTGAAAAVLLHIARRWHYEIAPLDTGEGGITGHRTDRASAAAFESNHLSGTAIALYPRAYPLGGIEPLAPHHETVVRDILLNCEGTVSWGGDLQPVKASHFHLAVPAHDATLARVAARLDTSRPTRTGRRRPTAGVVAGPEGVRRR